MSRNIGEAARASGVSAKMIRYYEEIGLVPRAARSGSGYREFDDEHIHTLRFIRRARELGFPVADIMQLMELWRDRDRASGDVKRLALGHIESLKAKMQELQAMVDVLQALAESCEGDHRPSCPILENLAEGAP
jgi:Cu(I)-responsive transcriptional regulator